MGEAFDAVMAARSAASTQRSRSGRTQGRGTNQRTTGGEDDEIRHYWRAPLLAAVCDRQPASIAQRRSSSPTSPSSRAAAPPSAPTGRTASTSRSRRSTPRAACSAARSRSRTPIRRPIPASRARRCRRRSTTSPMSLLGPGYSGSVKVTAPLAGRGRHRADHGRRSGRADARPATSTCSAPRSASSRRCRRSPNTSHDDVKAKTVAVVWVNNDFGKGGRDAIIKELERARHQGRRRPLDRSRPGRFRRRRRARSRPPIPTRCSST